MFLNTEKRYKAILTSRANELRMCVVDPKNRDSFVACKRAALEGLNPIEKLTVIAMTLRYSN